MTAKTNFPNCETGHCDDHSGLMMWMKGCMALMAVTSGLLAYSVMWQAPNIRMDIAKEIARLDAKDTANGYEIKTIQRDVTDIGRRVTFLEGK